MCVRVYFCASVSLPEGGSVEGDADDWTTSDESGLASCDITVVRYAMVKGTDAIELEGRMIWNSILSRRLHHEDLLLLRFIFPFAASSARIHTAGGNRLQQRYRSTLPLAQPADESSDGQCHKASWDKSL